MKFSTFIEQINYLIRYIHGKRRSNKRTIC